MSISPNIDIKQAYDKEFIEFRSDRVGAPKYLKDATGPFVVKADYYLNGKQYSILVQSINGGMAFSVFPDEVIRRLKVVTAA